MGNDAQKMPYWMGLSPSDFIEAFFAEVHPDIVIYAAA
jgi:hypothetical protein